MDNDAHGNAVWEIKCYCDNIFSTKAYYITTNHTRSCGCLALETRTKHGGVGTRLWGIWNSMKSRCNHPSHTSYNKYGARGIKIHDEWLDFNIFREWAYSNGYNDELTIERKDVNKDYTPDNCEWADWTEQARNKRVRKNSRSGVTGVIWDKNKERWRVRITNNYKEKDLGRYSSLREAIEARRQGERTYWGKEYQDFDSIISSLNSEELE